MHRKTPARLSASVSLSLSPSHAHAHDTMQDRSTQSLVGGVFIYSFFLLSLWRRRGVEGGIDTAHRKRLLPRGSGWCFESVSGPLARGSSFSSSSAVRMLRLITDLLGSVFSAQSLNAVQGRVAAPLLVSLFVPKSPTVPFCQATSVTSRHTVT